MGNYYKVKRISNLSPVECDDPWVQDLAVMACNDASYMNMVSHIELGTEINNKPQECELSPLTSNYNRLSTLTLKGGTTLILRDNTEIMVTMAARENIKQISH